MSSVHTDRTADQGLYDKRDNALDSSRDVPNDKHEVAVS